MEFIKQFFAITFLVFMVSVIVLYAHPILSLAIVVAGGWLVGQAFKPVYGVIAAIVIAGFCLLSQKFGVSINSYLGFKKNHIAGMFAVAAIVAITLMLGLSVVKNDDEKSSS